MGVINGRVAIVTGGARGIGASISRLFAAEGASLVISDLGAGPDGSGSDEGPAKQIADEIVAAGGTAGWSRPRSISSASSTSSSTWQASCATG
jgi:NAD(P)-dependent dehydrogenase (short-subunit alcohol dehydrogenase family)